MRTYNTQTQAQRDRDQWATYEQALAWVKEA